MIWVREDVLWVRAANGQLTPFDPHRLWNAIHGAAATLGNPDWWLAEALVAAVQAYLRDQARDNIVDAGALGAVVGTVLEKLGYAEIATAYQHRDERTEIRLDQIAGPADAPLELAFYRQLDGALHRVADAGLTVVQLRGLRSCVMRLRGAHRWGGGCRQLAEEIVAHVRERVARLRPEHAALLRLAVLD